MMVTQGGNSEESSLAAYYVLHKRKEFNYVGDYVLSGDEAGGYCKDSRYARQALRERLLLCSPQWQKRHNTS